MAPKDSPPKETIDLFNVGIELEGDNADSADDTIMISATEEVSPDEKRFLISPKPPRERRNWKRFAIDGAVVMVMKQPRLSFLKPVYLTLGPVKDIGMKGLAVHYVDKRDEMAFKKGAYLSITLPGGRTVVDKIPFKIVNTFKVADLPGNKEVWNLCVSFERLLPMQRIQIERFIEEYGEELKALGGKPE